MCANEKAIYTIIPSGGAGSGFQFEFLGETIGKGDNIVILSNSIKFFKPGLYSFSGRVLSDMAADRASITLEKSCGEIIFDYVSSNCRPTTQGIVNCFDMTIPERVFYIDDIESNYQISGQFFNTIFDQTYFTIREV